MCDKYQAILFKRLYIVKSFVCVQKVKNKILKQAFILCLIENLKKCQHKIDACFVKL